MFQVVLTDERCICCFVMPYKVAMLAGLASMPANSLIADFSRRWTAMKCSPDDAMKSDVSLARIEKVKQGDPRDNMMELSKSQLQEGRAIEMGSGH